MQLLVLELVHQRRLANTSLNNQNHRDRQGHPHNSSSSECATDPNGAGPASLGPGRAAAGSRLQMSWWKGSTRTEKSALNRTFPPRLPPYPRECKKQERSQRESDRQQCAEATS
eukprot:1579867-Pleurochrysis_carterae.AAC.1